MRATSSTHHQRLRSSARFRVGLAILIASSGLVSAMVVSSPSASAAPLTVTNCNSSGPGSLAAVVAGAAANSTITFSVTCSSITVTSTIDLTVPLTIEGPGASALEVDDTNNSDEQSAEIFEVSPNIDVSMSGLSIQNGDPGIDNQGTLTLTDCTMGSDQSQPFATGISNEGTLTLSQCNITGNDDYYGYDNTSTGLTNSGTATLSDCTITGTETDNTLIQTGGTAVWNQEGGQLTINSCTFKHNTAYYGNGTIENDGGSTTITGSTVSDNNKGLYGAGIANDTGTMSISGSTVLGNAPGGISNGGTLTVSDSTVDSNQGGGIDSRGMLSVADSTLSNNIGGGIEGGGSTTITGSTISNNSVRGKFSGGGISNTGMMNIAGSTISGNNSNNGTGGGIYNDSSLTLTDSNVSGNSNVGGGAGIDNAGSLNVSDSTISKNTVVDAGGEGGGAILNSPLPKSSLAASLVLTASTLAENHSNTHGGGIENDGGTALVTGSTLAQNASDKQGGGINNVEGGSATLAATVVAASSPQDCSGVVADTGYNLDDDASCGFSSANHSYSGVQPYLGPLQNNGGPTKTEEPAIGSPLIDDIPMGATANGVALCPSTDQRGVARPQGSECDIGAVELSPTPQDITSPDDAVATAGQTFSFTVTTTGAPVPKLSETGSLPKKLSFVDHGNGTATISGKAKKVGSSELLIKAKFGGYLVLQVLTLTVTAG